MTTVRNDNLLPSPTTAPAEPAHESAPRPTALMPEPRIELRRRAGAGTYVDGGWWPHSLDLIAELPPLLAAAEAAGYGEVRRVSYAIEGWDGRPPRKTTMLNRVVKLGGFNFQDSAEIDLVDSSGWKRVTIAVVPPQADPAAAHRALAMSGTDGDRHTAREILTLAATPAHAPESACVDELS